jgi:hypothetical protein
LGFFRAVLTVVLSALVVLLGIVQFASEALCARAAAPHTLPRRLPASFGERVYAVLDRLAPAPYVESSLAQLALERGDGQTAQHYALRLPASTNRDELLSRIAAAMGSPQLALEYALAAFDADTVAARATRLGVADPRAAYELEALLARRLLTRTTHPDAVAQARWQMGIFANETAWRKVPGSAPQRVWLQTAFADFNAAARLAPLSERYAIAAANQADLLGERLRAEQLFRQAAAIDPGSADAVAGLGVLAVENGDRAAARAYLARARALDARSLMVRALERDLQ